MAEKKKPLTASEMGKRGGKARVAKLTPEERSEEMRKLIKRRWRLAKAKKKAEAEATAKEGTDER